MLSTTQLSLEQSLLLPPPWRPGCQESLACQSPRMPGLPPTHGSDAVLPAVAPRERPLAEPVLPTMSPPLSPCLSATPSDCQSLSESCCSETCLEAARRVLATIGEVETLDRNLRSHHTNTQRYQICVTPRSCMGCRLRQIFKAPSLDHIQR